MKSLFSPFVIKSASNCLTQLIVAFPLTLALSFSLERVQAEITSAADGTGTDVKFSGNQFDIRGGQTSADGSNLFHSFTNFGLDEGKTANFISPTANIQNILGRITGTEPSPSIINGTIQVSGSNANLFLMNPAGIIFGANARLNVSGDFTATTATSIGFGTDSLNWFNATGDNNYAALGGSPSAFAFTYTETNSPVGVVVNTGSLTVGTGKNLTFLGGTVVNAGQLSAPGGKITVLTVPSERIVRLSQPGHVLSLDMVSSADSQLSASTLTVLSLPELLTGGTASNATKLVISDGKLQLTGAGISVASGDIITGDLTTDKSDNGGKITLNSTAGAINTTLGKLTSDGGDITLSAQNDITTGSLDSSTQKNSDSQGNITLTSTAGAINTTAGELTSSGNGKSQKRNGGDIILSAPNAIATADINSGNGNITLTSNEIDFTENAKVQGRGTLSLQPFTPGLAIEIGGTGDTDALDLTTDEIKTLQDGFSTILIGGNNGSGAITVSNPVEFKDSTELNAGTASITVLSSLAVNGKKGGGNEQANLTLTADQINLLGGSDSISGTGKLVLQPFTSDRAITLGIKSDDPNALQFGQGLNSLKDGFSHIFIGQSDGSGSITVSTPLTVKDPITLRAPSGEGSITATAAITGITEDVAVNLFANRNIITTDINASAGIQMRSTNGDIDTRAGTLNSGNGNGNGGNIDLQAFGKISTSHLFSFATGSADQSNGGAITLSATTGDVTTGFIDSSSTTLDGGKVTITGRNVNVGTINTQSLGSGKGGDIDITAEQYFYANDSFKDQNGIDASLSSADGTGGGAITIRHGGNGIVPFLVGNATVNGTAGAITTGASNRISPTQSFSGSYTQGNIQLQTQGLPGVETLQPELQTQSQSQSQSQSSNGVTSPLPVTNLSPLSIDTVVAKLEESVTSEFEDHLGIKDTAVKTLQDTQTMVTNIEETTGVKPAIIYVVFTPATLPPAGEQASQGDSSIQNSQSSGVAVHRTIQNANDQLELILVTSKGQPIRKQVPSALRSRVLQVATQFRSAVIQNRSAGVYLPPAQQLYQWLVAPLESDLQALGIQNLVFIMDAGLRAVPLAALHDGKGFLVERYSVGLMPSLSLTDTRFKSLKGVEVLAMGAAKFSDKRALPSVPAELSLVTRELWHGKSFLNEAFTLENLKSERSKQPFGIVHLATHSEFNPGTPSNSYIQLWDTQLKLDQMGQLDWKNPPVELLVLSACRTALGDEQAELGFAGLAVLAGAKSAVASLWYVSDEGTLGLMIDFYAQLRQAPIKAQALREAQVAMIKGEVRVKAGQMYTHSTKVPLPPELAKLQDKDFSHPYYWAAFTMIGSPW